MKSSRWRKAVVLGAGLLIVGTWIAIPSLPAQTKKGDPKKVDPKTVKPPVVLQDILVAASGHEQIKYINDSLEKLWQENKITPSDRCTDYEFIRRATLDIIGRIAKPNEISEFLSWPANKRRSMLIEKLLDDTEYAHNWATIWTNLLLTRQGIPKPYQESFHHWMQAQLVEKYDADAKPKRIASAPDWSKTVTEILTATGKDKENSAVNYILAHMGEPVPAPNRNENPNAIDQGRFDFVPVTSRTTRLFLGLRTQCVQCHDHKFNDEWKQEHFWGINAFFRQVSPSGRPNMMAKKKGPKEATHISVSDDPNLNPMPKPWVEYERHSGVRLYTDPTFLDGSKIDWKKSDGQTSRRAELAKFVTKSPFFAKAYVNRTWGHFFGKSFTKDAVDDFGEHNPASNQELLDWLAKEWAEKYNHDPKHLIRWICNSRAYGLSSIANRTNDKVEDETLFSRMLLKAMTPEQLFESLMVATNAKAAQVKESRASLRQAWLDRLVVNFGNDEGEEGSYSGTVIQALLLMNGDDINKAIADEKEGTVAEVLRAVAKTKKFENQAAEAMRSLFLAALNRPPTKAEYNRMLAPKMYLFRPEVQKGLPVNMAFATAFYQDMFWALLNSNEFILNH